MQACIQSSRKFTTIFKKNRKHKPVQQENYYNLQFIIFNNSGDFDMNWRNLLMGLCTALALTACGGGGGNGDTAQLSFNTTPISLSWEEGTTPPSGVFRFTATGTTNDGIYTGWTNPQNHISSAYIYENSNTSFYFSIMPSPSLKEGVYTGSFTAHICRDNDRTKHYPGSPATVNYTLNVTPTVKTSVSEISLNTQSGISATKSFTVQIPPGTTEYSVRVTGNESNSISVSKSGSTVTISSQPVRSGSYTASIYIETTKRSILIPVTLKITPPIGGESDAKPDVSSINLNASAGGISTTQSIKVTPPTWGGDYSSKTGSTSYPVADYSWLKINKSNPNEYSVQADASKLTKGNYQAYVCFGESDHPYSGNTSCTTVNLTVGEGLVIPLVQAIIINSDTTKDQLKGHIKIETTPGVNLQSWNASSDASWLIINKASGIAGDSIAYEIDPSQIKNNSQGTSTIRVNTTPSNIGSITITINVKKILAEILTINPSAIATGKASEVIITGYGFKGGGTPSITHLGLQNINSILDVNGLSLSKLEVLSDSKIKIEVPALSPGKYNISTNNPLNLPTNKKVLSIIATNIPNAEINSPGIKRAVLFDLNNSSIFEVDKYKNILLRHHYSGLQWEAKSISIDGLIDAALSLDGQHIIALQKNGQVLFINPQSMNVEKEYATTLTSTRYISQLNDFGRGLCIAADGKIWFAASISINGAPTWDSFAYFDPTTEIFALRTPSPFYANMHFAQSGDGSRIIAGSNYSGMQSMNTENQTVESVISHTEFSDLAINFNGSIFVKDAKKVYDSKWNNFGSLNIGSDRKALAALPSSNGKRIYVLHIPSPLDYGQPLFGDLKLSIFSSEIATTGDLPLINSLTVAKIESKSYTSGGLGAYKMALTPDEQKIFISGGEKLRIFNIPAESQSNGVVRRTKGKIQSILNTAPIKLFK